MAAKQSAEAFAELDGEPPELVPEGEYQLRFLYHETKSIFDRPKIFLWFSILDMGEHFGKHVPRYYGAKHLIGAQKGSRGGSFKVGRKSDFLREFLTVCPAYLNKRRLDRLPISRLETVIIIGKIRTVTHGRNQRPIPPDAQYSVIGQLIRAKE